jgi:putative oxidoreductase
MNTLISIHNFGFERIGRLTPAILPTLARLVFAGTLLVYFWNSAMLKLGDGILGFINISAGAYIQMFPKAFEAAGYDPSALGVAYKLIAVLGTWAEFLLPLLIVVGLMTRLASLGMIGFVLVQSLTDIYGHGVDAVTIGTWFDAASGALIADQRAFWMLLLISLALLGGGPLSVDRLLARRQAASG